MNECAPLHCCSPLLRVEQQCKYLRKKKKFRKVGTFKLICVLNGIHLTMCTAFTSNYRTIVIIVLLLLLLSLYAIRVYSLNGDKRATSASVSMRVSTDKPPASNAEPKSNKFMRFLAIHQLMRTMYKTKKHREVLLLFMNIFNDLRYAFTPTNVRIERRVPLSWMLKYMYYARVNGINRSGLFSSLKQNINRHG